MIGNRLHAVRSAEDRRAAVFAQASILVPLLVSLSLFAIWLLAPSKLSLGAASGFLLAAGVLVGLVCGGPVIGFAAVFLALRAGRMSRTTVVGLVLNAVVLIVGWSVVLLVE